jgi:hypothetical protein
MSLPTETEMAFRYEDCRYASMDEDAGSGPLVVELRRWPVVRHTPKGFWIQIGFANDCRFVLKGARKQYACLSLEDAVKSFRARKERQASIYKHRLDDAKLALMLCNDLPRPQDRQPIVEITL